jgi:hypothetical protein
VGCEPALGLKKLLISGGIFVVYKLLSVKEDIASKSSRDTQSVVVVEECCTSKHLFIQGLTPNANVQADALDNRAST